jgi:release factor glutamine methyltransferase
MTTKNNGNICAQDIMRQLASDFVWEGRQFEFTNETDRRRFIRDLRLLVAKIKNVSYETVVFNAHSLYFSEAEISALNDMWRRYRKNEPISKIINKKSFWKYDFFVNEDVIDPRPETELILELLLARFASSAALRFLDVGTGSGCLLLSILSEFPQSIGVGIDVCPKAIAVAEYNKKKLNISSASFFTINWNHFLADASGADERHFDVIVSNPPYIKTSHLASLPDNVKNYDPPMALDGGPIGLNAYVEIAALLAENLLPDGIVYFEIGYDQGAAISNILAENGFASVEIKKDINGLDRVLVAERIAN